MNEFDMIVLDEIFASYNYDLVDKASVRNIVENYGGELVMTGRNPDEWFCERADYISEIKKIKHPYDKGIVACKEPFKKLVHQGMILGENGIKMGKRYPKFVVNPSDIVKKYGADTLRLYEMFMGPLEQSKPWSMAGCDGARRWIDRVYRLFIESGKVTDTNDGKLDKVYNQTVKKVTEDYESLGFNTAISQMMIFVNDAYKAETIYKPYAEGIVKMLSCITPHIGEEMWQLLGHEDTIAYEPWPTYDEAKLVEDTITCVVQVNGKVRGKFVAAVGSSNEELEKQAMELETVKRQIEGKTIRKVIVVKGKVVNIVAN